MIRNKYKTIAMTIAISAIMSSSAVYANELQSYGVNKSLDVSDDFKSEEVDRLSNQNEQVKRILGASSTTQIKLAGTTRYQTAVAISKAGWSTSENAILVNATALPDALCASPLADEYNAPILLTEREQVNSDTLAELKRLGVKNVTVIGSEGVITKGQEDQLRSLGFSVDRLGGITRYDTSLKIASKLDEVYKSKGITKKPVFIANGVKGLADATSVSSPAGIKNGVILYSDGTNLNGIKTYIVNNASQIYIVGSEGVVNKAVETELRNTGIPVTRLGGVDRKDTNAKVIAEFFGDKTKATKVYVAKDGMGAENQLVDGLAVGSLASKNNSPVMLASNNLGDSQKTALQGRSVTELVQVGDGVNNTPASQAMAIITANAVPEGGGSTTSPDGMKLPTIQYATEKSMKMSGSGGWYSVPGNEIQGTITVKYGNPSTRPHSYGAKNQQEYDYVVNYVKDKVKNTNFRLCDDWVYTQYHLNGGRDDNYIDPILLANNITVPYKSWRVNNKYIVIGLDKGIVSREDAEKLAIYNSVLGSVLRSMPENDQNINDGSPYSAMDYINGRIDCDSSAEFALVVNDILSGYSGMIGGTDNHQEVMIRVGGYYWNNGRTPTLKSTDDWRSMTCVLEAPTY